MKFGNEQAALAVLKENFEWGPPNFGLIRPKKEGYKPTDRENEAIDFLFLEYDFTATL